MAGRPTKQGIDYFTVDVEFFSNVKIRKVSRACGAQSVSILICLLCNIYKGKGYYIEWNEDLSFVIADTVGVTEGLVKETLSKALQVGFFDNELYEKYKILTSKRIQKQFFLATYQRKETVTNPDFLINCSNNSINCAINSINHVDNEQSKSKSKSKNNIIPPTPPLEGGGAKKKKQQSPKKDTGLNGRARMAFEEHYKKTFGESYYWTAKDAGAMTQLLQKLKFQREQKSMDVSDDSMMTALSCLLSSIREGWIFENFSVTNINSKFNEIVSNARKTAYGKSNMSVGVILHDNSIDKYDTEEERKLMARWNK